MDEIQDPSVKDFQFFSKNDPNAPFTSLGSVDERCLGWLLYRLLRQRENASAPLLAALPELRQLESAMATIRALKKTFGGNFHILTIPECSRGKLLFPGGESARSRALHEALTQPCDLVIGSIHAFTAPAPAPEATREAELRLMPGMEIEMSKLLEKLVVLDYDDEYEAVVSGEFARRGGVIDIFSPAHDFPCRVEFFGDTVESLRRYDPATQRSTGNIEDYQIIGRSGITAGGAHDSDLFEYFQNRPFSFLEIYPENLTDRLERFGDPEKTRRLSEIEAECLHRNQLIQWHELADQNLPESPVLPLDFDNGPLPEGTEKSIRGRSLELKRKLLSEYLHQAAESGIRLFLSATRKELLGELKRFAAAALPEQHPRFLVLPVAEGAYFSADRAILLPEVQLAAAGFSRGAVSSDTAEGEPEPEEPSPDSTPERSDAEAEEERRNNADFSLADLEEGDLAVHVDHGIGIYRGIRMLESNGAGREVMVLEFQDSQLMYVPVIQASKISRYLGAVGKVKLHTLGRKKWEKDKENARKGVRSYAAEMLRFQALRMARPGIRFPKETAEDREFRLAFPFTDTPDQTRATAEILRDMESERPMDRLLCGDVGYGKTEVAMRAVEKAVAAGYQVAVLAPTTLLAQQHFLSFSERFAPYPYTVGQLSRFRSAAEQSETIRQLQSGALDIVIGTHRLCNPEIHFHNLGLVVIDEEQRFGVRHKERLRRFRAEVDVLTMSATPIPRTLYMAMAGGRDLSTLMTAPKLRLPVKTTIAPAEDSLIAQAMRAEFARGGQVYYLYNRVKTIENRAAQLRALLPDAKIGVAHGQMEEGKLEEIMADFLSGKLDCLVCSTIVESGLDVPNANTIIIERADRFGLAELYQLRGRVGRWKHQAYAYMLLPKDQLVSSDARKRLSAIRRCSNLGAGFQLALRDLEIRGSGNLLGSEQSGHLNLIGFELYCQLLKQELAQMKGEEIRILPEVEMGIDFFSFGSPAPKGSLEAAFPRRYIGAERLRLDAYRKLGRLNSLEELNDFEAELNDRYGKLPKAAKNLLSYIRLRLLAALGNFEYFTVVNGTVMLRKAGSPAMFRIDGKLPRIDPRNPPEMRILHLTKLLEDQLRQTIPEAPSLAHS